MHVVVSIYGKSSSRHGSDLLFIAKSLVLDLPHKIAICVLSEIWRLKIGPKLAKYSVLVRYSPDMKNLQLVTVSCSLFHVHGSYTLILYSLYSYIILAHHEAKRSLIESLNNNDSHKLVHVFSYRRLRKISNMRYHYTIDST